MTRMSILTTTLFLSFSLIGSVACSSDADEDDAPACSTDNDCKGDRICQQNQCIDPDQEDTDMNAEDTDMSSSGPACTTPDDCQAVECPCKSGEVSYTSCSNGQCATLDACEEFCADRGGLRDTSCDGEFSIGDSIFTTSDSIIGNECDNYNQPQNCWRGDFIQFDSQNICRCTPECSSIGEGANCSDDGEYTCQRIRSYGGSSGLYCVREAWNLCTP